MTEVPPTPPGTPPPAEAAGDAAAPAASAQQLAPPAAATTLVLEPPQPVAAVEPAASASMVPLDAAALPGLDQMVGEYVDSLVDARPQDARVRGRRPRASARWATTTSAPRPRSATACSRAPVKAMAKGGFDEGRQGVEHVAGAAPHRSRTSTRRRQRGSSKLLGIIPFGDKLRDYFHRYESAQTHLNAILNALYEGQDELRKDNAALEQEKVHLWETMQRLGAVHLPRRAPRRRRSTAKIAEIEATDAERAKTLREDVLFYVRQKHQDLLTQLAVSIQGYLAIDLVRKNNIELIKGVDRATTTTISALRTAVIVAQALANQRLVLEPDHRAQHDDVEPHRVDVEDARDARACRSTSRRRRRRSASTSCRRRSRTSTRRWTRSTPSRCRRSARCRRRSTRSTPRSRRRRRTSPACATTSRATPTTARCSIPGREVIT